MNRTVAASPPALLAAAVLTVAIAVTAVFGLITTSDPSPAHHDRGDGLPSAGRTAGDTAPADPSAPASSTRAPSSGPAGSAARTSTGAPAHGTAGAAAACSDIAAIQADNAGLNSSSLAKVRADFVHIEGSATDLVRDAPKVINGAARAFRQAVRTLRGFVDRAHSVNDLANQTQRDPKLSRAFTDLSAADQHLSTWAASNC